MADGTQVFNLATGTWLTYVGHTPLQAVQAAWRLYTRKDGNTWTWDTVEAPVRLGGWTVGCGDYCALLEVDRG